jgi:hypothetical protein
MIWPREIALENAGFSKDPASRKQLPRIITVCFDIKQGYLSTGDIRLYRRVPGRQQMDSAIVDHGLDPTFAKLAD